ncbi:cyclopropane-fatty-acyl-phospholipid synthase family protein [Candidatus Pelagibacter sp.]|jgi:cyclopropane-fatty-acyl-phospholipid synthase|nr:cyclopropane-fatty-acyl-phospholipid synthase family protein [Candidatus Pelagibacter sp.]
MSLVSFLNNLIQYDGFELVDANSKKYVIGNPIKEKPIVLKLLDQKLMQKLLINPDLYFGEAYMNGSLVIENGTITEFLDLAFRNIGRGDINFYGTVIKKIKGTFRYLTSFNKILKSKENVAHHYDISEKLYDLFLDKNRQYSCAYFKNDNDTLEEAQKNKMHHIIKKLNIKPNQKVLDIGSGWGTLALEIAKETNASVTGITLSENQFEYSKNKAKEMNLSNQVEFKLIDYRQLNEKFDKIVSVGMFEHVGRKFYRTYFNTVSKLLNEKGIALIHTIGSTMPPRDPQPWITKYIFPGGYTPSLSEAVKPIEDSGLIISDIEVLRLHYAHTLRHWKERFLSKKDAVLDMFDEKFFRMWEFYLASCEMAFKWGDQVVFQFQLTKDNTSVPNTRDYIY